MTTLVERCGVACQTNLFTDQGEGCRVGTERGMAVSDIGEVGSKENGVTRQSLIVGELKFEREVLRVRIGVWEMCVGVEAV